MLKVTRPQKECQMIVPFPHPNKDHSFRPHLIGVRSSLKLRSRNVLLVCSLKINSLRLPCRPKHVSKSSFGLEDCVFVTVGTRSRFTYLRKRCLVNRAGSFTCLAPLKEYVNPAGYPYHHLISFQVLVPINIAVSSVRHALLQFAVRLGSYPDFGLRGALKDSCGDKAIGTVPACDRIITLDISKCSEWETSIYDCSAHKTGPECDIWIAWAGCKFIQIRVPESTELKDILSQFQCITRCDMSVSEIRANGKSVPWTARSGDLRCVVLRVFAEGIPGCGWSRRAEPAAQTGGLRRHSPTGGRRCDHPTSRPPPGDRSAVQTELGHTANSDAGSSTTRFITHRKQRCAVSGSLDHLLAHRQLLIRTNVRNQILRDQGTLPP